MSGRAGEYRAAAQSPPNLPTKKVSGPQCWGATSGVAALILRASEILSNARSDSRNKERGQGRGGLKSTNGVINKFAEWNFFFVVRVCVRRCGRVVG